MYWNREEENGKLTGYRSNTGKYLMTPQPVDGRGTCWRVTDTESGAENITHTIEAAMDMVKAWEGETGHV